MGMREFQSLHPTPLLFSDAAYGPSTYNLGILCGSFISTIYYYYSF
jgi:hypothetical protein